MVACQEVLFFPSPLVGEGGFAKRSRMRGLYPRRQTPHPSAMLCIASTLSHKERGEEGGFSRAMCFRLRSVAPWRRAHFRISRKLRPAAPSPASGPSATARQVAPSLCGSHSAGSQARARRGLAESSRGSDGRSVSASAPCANSALAAKNCSRRRRLTRSMGCADIVASRGVRIVRSMALVSTRCIATCRIDRAKLSAIRAWLAMISSSKSANRDWLQ
jgi:hypothetical protein